MKFSKETILGAMFIELNRITNDSMQKFLLQHESLLARYVNFEVLKKIVISNEENGIVSDLEESRQAIQCAEKLALGGKEPDKKIIRKNLCSIFSNLTVDGKYPPKAYYTPALLDGTAAIPSFEERKTKELRLWEKFCSELDMCAKNPPEDFEAFLVILDTLLRKYLWSIPASNNKDEDISFYDFVRTVAAITAASTCKIDENKPFLIAAGHFSGIQKYIFTVSRVGTGGVTKRLRARSFYVNAMVSALAHSIVYDFQMPLLNILMLTGGKFYILLPNTAEAETKLKKIETEMTKFLYEKYKGNLSLELVWQAVTENELIDYSSTVALLSHTIRQKKKRVLEDMLISENMWNPENFVVYKNLAHKSMCKSCKSALIEADTQMCPACTIDTEIGGKLPKIKSFSFSREKGEYNLLGKYFLNLNTGKEGIHPYLVKQINNSVIQNYDKPAAVSYMVNNVPVDEMGNIKTFHEIAETAKGAKRLGVLKADVDTLGFLFAEGAKKEENRSVSVSRSCTFSRMLDLFFGGCISDLIRNKYKETYCIFSGGDDLFFIGPWDQMPELALDINRLFHEYTGNNPCMTLSAAICMANGNGHIAVFAEECEKKLHMVKQQADELISPGKKGRNGIYLLGDIMTWENLETQLNQIKWLMKAGKEISTGTLRQLELYSDMYRKYLREKDTESLMFIPLFANYKTRNYKALYQEHKEFGDFCDKLYKNVSDYTKVDKQFYYMKFCISYELLLTKEERKNAK